MRQIWIINTSVDNNMIFDACFVASFLRRDACSVASV